MIEINRNNSAPSNFQFLIADDHSLVRHCLTLLLKNEWSNADCHFAFNSESLFAQLQTLKHGLNIVLLDLRMPGMVGIESVKQVLAETKNAKVIVCSGLDDPNLTNNLKRCGVYSVVHKSEDPQVLINEIKLALNIQDATSVLRNSLQPIQLKKEDTKDTKYPKNCLTQRQREILQLLHQGKPSKLIARDLGVELGTIKSHLHSLYFSMNVKNRAEAIVKSQDWLL